MSACCGNNCLKTTDFSAEEKREAKINKTKQNKQNQTKKNEKKYFKVLIP